MQDKTKPARRKKGRYLRLVWGHFKLAWEVFCRMPALSRWPVRQVFLKQLYFTGLESLFTITIAGLIVGLIVIMQTNNLVGRNEQLTSQIMIWILIRELGPLLTAFVIIGRSSSAFASELSSMQVNGEIKSLRHWGISPISYLIVPRVLAMTLSSMVLTFYFLVFAISIGGIVTALRLDLSLAGLFSKTLELISFNDAWASWLKSILFGFMVAIVSCYHGLRRKTAMTEVPQAVSQAVIRSLMTVFVGDGIITVMVFS